MTQRCILKSPSGKNLVVCIEYKWAAETTSEICSILASEHQANLIKKAVQARWNDQSYKDVMASAIVTPL